MLPAFYLQNLSALFGVFLLFFVFVWVVHHAIKLLKV